MTVKERTALISILLNVVLTVLKFVAFFFSGSLAILVEAWHSFSDITTSILVFISVKEPPFLLTKAKEKDGSKSNILEHQISFVIGLLMFIISVVLIYKAIMGRALVIEHSLITGIIFIIFGIASHIVYRFETSVGKREGSVGLIADGMHAKADMVNSLLIGFSLILYKLGLNIDSFVAFLIALLILSFSIETMSNVALAYRRKEEGYVFSYKTMTMVLSLFEKSTWSTNLKYLENKLGLKLPNLSLLQKMCKSFGVVLILLLVLICASDCYYTIGPGQEGIIERFGKPVNSEPIQPGIHFKFPRPIDNVIKIDSKVIRMKSIGNITDENTFALLWTRKHGTEKAFVSGDNNFFYPYLVIHYRIKDIFEYQYNHFDTEILFDNIANQVISNIFSKKEFYEIVTSYRKQLELDIAKNIQKKLDELNSGLEVINTNMKDVHPPIFISSSFEEVIAAYQKKEEMINKAIGYKNESLLSAKGDREKLLKQAQAYVTDETKRADGKASRFMMQWEGYQESKDIITKKLYYDFVKEALSQNQKVFVDPSSGLPEIWIGDKELFNSYKYGLD
jgi:membrane protease subunit HflK